MYIAHCSAVAKPSIPISQRRGCSARHRAKKPHDQIKTMTLSVRASADFQGRTRSKSVKNTGKPRLVIGILCRK